MGCNVTVDFALAACLTLGVIGMFSFQGCSELAEPPDPLIRLATPSFYPDGGELSNWLNMTITCSTEGATIRYTIPTLIY